MLTLEPPYYLAHGITVFRDHEDADLFYFLPGRPALARDGDRVAFTLDKYRRDLTDNPALNPDGDRGGGLALFEVEMAAPDAAALRVVVATQSGRGDARLVPVVFTSGTVRAIVAKTSGDALIDDVTEAHAAPLVAPYRTAFALALSSEGATLFQRASEGGDLPIGVAYDLRFLALTPSLHARVRMHFDRIYDHFSASIGFTYYVSVKLDLDLTWLIEHDLVTIEITAFTDSDDAERQRKQVMDLVTARIKQDFFHTGVPPAGDDGAGALGQLMGSLTGGSKLSSASAVFVLKARAEVVKESKELELVYDGRTAVELAHAPAAALGGMNPDGPPLDVRTIDLDDPFFSTFALQAMSVIDHAALPDLTEAVVDFSVGDHRESFAFSSATPGPYTVQIPLDHLVDGQYRHSIAFHFDPDRGSGPPLITAGPFTSRSRALVVNPLEHLRYRRVRFLLGPMDPARVPRLWIEVIVRDDERDEELARERFSLDARTPERLFCVHQASTGAPLTVHASTSWEDASGQTHPGETTEIVGDTHVALGPYRDVLTILAQPAVDWSKTTEVLVEIRYAVGDYEVDHALHFGPADGSHGQRVEIPLLDPTQRGYHVRQTIFHVDGTTPSEIPWTDVDQGVLVIGAEKPTTADLQVVWVGDAGDSFGLRVDVWARGPLDVEQQASSFLRAGVDKSQRLTLPLDAEGKLGYRYEVRRIGPAGEELVHSGEATSTLLVVQASSG